MFFRNSRMIISLDYRKPFIVVPFKEDSMTVDVSVEMLLSS